MNLRIDTSQAQTRGLFRHLLIDCRHSLRKIHQAKFGGAPAWAGISLSALSPSPDPPTVSSLTQTEAGPWKSERNETLRNEIFKINHFIFFFLISKPEFSHFNTFYLLLLLLKLTSEGSQETFRHHGVEWKLFRDKKENLGYGDPGGSLCSRTFPVTSHKNTKINTK